MGWLDKNLPQDIEGVGDNDWCVKASIGYDEDSRRGKYDNYRDERDYSESKHQ